MPWRYLPEWVLLSWAVPAKQCAALSATAEQFCPGENPTKQALMYISGLVVSLICTETWGEKGCLCQNRKEN